MIACRLRKQPTKYGKEDTSGNEKYGSYTQRYYHSIKGYGKKYWVICADILLDYEKEKENYSDDEIVQQCIKYLNTPHKSRYGKKRKKKLPYGIFNSQPVDFWLKEKDGSKYFQTMLIINEKKNKKFWGEGPSLL